MFSVLLILYQLAVCLEQVAECWSLILHWVISASLLFKQSLELSLVLQIRSMLILKFDLATVDLALDIHELSKSFKNVRECSVLFIIYVIIIELIDFEASILNWLDIEDVIGDSSEKIIDLLLILIFRGNDDLLIKVVDTNNVADECLQGSLEPVYPSTVGFYLNLNVIVSIHTGHVTV